MKAAKSIVINPSYPHIKKNSKFNGGIFAGVTWVDKMGRPNSADNWDNNIDLENINSPIYAWVVDYTNMEN